MLNILLVHIHWHAFGERYRRDEQSRSGVKKCDHVYTHVCVNACVWSCVCLRIKCAECFPAAELISRKLNKNKVRGEASERKRQRRTTEDELEITGSKFVVRQIDRDKTVIVTRI